MIKVLTAILVLLIQQGMGPGPGTPASSGGGGGIAFVQAATTTASTGTTVTVTTSSSGSGNFLVASCAQDSITATLSITDNLSDAWTAATATTESVFNIQQQLFYLVNTPSGVTSVVCHSNTSTPNVLIGIVEEFSGVATSSVVDGTQQNATTRGFSNPATWTTPTITTTNAADLLIQANADGNSTTYTASTGWTLPTGGQSSNAFHRNSALQYRIVSSTGTYAPTGSFTVGGNSNTLVTLFAFK